MSDGRGRETDRQSSRKSVECVCVCVSKTRLAPERATKQDFKNGGRGYDLYGSQTQGGDGDISTAAL